MIALLQSIILLLTAVSSPNVPLALQVKAITIAKQAQELSRQNLYPKLGGILKENIQYFDTYECFQSQQHFLKVKNANTELYQRTEPAGSCGWGGHKIRINVPIKNNYEKDYMRSKNTIYTILATSTIGIPN